MSDRTKDQSAEPREWLIRKRGYYYRPNRAGYTAAVAEAGRYTEAEAKNEAALDPWHMTALHQSEVDAGCTVTSNERADWRSLCLKLRDAVQAEGQAIQWGAGVKRARRELAAVWKEVEQAEKSPVETTTPRVTPVEVERLIDWHRMAAGVTEQTDDFVGARMHRERLRVWEAHRRGSPVEPKAGILLYKCGKCGTPMRCGPTQWEYQCECNTENGNGDL